MAVNHYDGRSEEHKPNNQSGDAVAVLGVAD
jgi:hypothetical protein